MIITLRTRLRNNNIALAAFALRVSANITVFSRYPVNNPAISSVNMSNMRIASAAHFFDPTASLFGNFFFALLLITGNIDNYASNRRIIIAQHCRYHVLQAAQRLGITANQNTIEVAAGNVNR